VTVLGTAPAARYPPRPLPPPTPSGRARVNAPAALPEWLAKMKFAGSTRLQVDIDPYSFL